MPLRFSGVTVTAALAVAYALGEGLGRLVHQRRLLYDGRWTTVATAPQAFCRFGFTFTGANKKACYEGGMQAALLPIQAVTSAVSVERPCGDCIFFYTAGSRYRSGPSWVHSLWRALSEVFRRDCGWRSLTAPGHVPAGNRLRRLIPLIVRPSRMSGRSRPWSLAL
jgi:hypothetical protein